MSGIDNNIMKFYLKKIRDEKVLVFDEIREIPKDYLTDEIIRLALSRHIRVLEILPDEKLTEEICLFAVAQHHAHAIPCYTPLQFIPESKRTYRVCLEAVRHHAGSIPFVPDKFLTPEICTLAIMQDGLAYFSIPEKYRTDEVFPLTLFTRGSMLQYIPLEKRTYYLCLIALSCSPNTDLSCRDDVYEATKREREEARLYIPKGMSVVEDSPGYREKRMFAMQAFSSMSRVESGFIRAIDEHMHFYGSNIEPFFDSLKKINTLPRHKSSREKIEDSKRKFEDIYNVRKFRRENVHKINRSENNPPFPEFDVNISELEIKKVKNSQIQSDLNNPHIDI